VYVCVKIQLNKLIFSFICAATPKSATLTAPCADKRILAAMKMKDNKTKAKQNKQNKRNKTKR
jgi:hypothetical protein